MANQEQYPEDSNATTQEQVPHSFRHGETPHREFDNTPLPDAVEQGLIITPDSPAILMPDKNSSGWKKRVVGLTAIVAALAGGIGFGMNATGGNNNNTEPRADASVSAPANPSETPPVSNFNPNSSINDNNFPNYMLQPNSDANGVMSNFDEVISYIVNQRVTGRAEAANPSDLQLLNNSNSENTVLEDYVAYIERNYKIGKDVWEEQGRGDIARLNFKSVIQSAESTSDGGYIITANDTYEALDSNDQYVGYVLSNVEERQYTFELGSITLPTGEDVETYVFSGVKTIN